MTVHAGVGLPGPFFIAFPILPFIGGVLGLILIPAYLMFYMLVGGLWLMGAMLYGIVWCTIKLVGFATRAAVAAHEDAKPTTPLTDEDRAFLASLDKR